MVKPPKTMEPSSITDMTNAGRDRQKAFGDDSFHIYMARKIDMQRHQFGSTQLPPPPPPRSIQTSSSVHQPSQLRQQQNTIRIGQDIHPGHQCTVKNVCTDPPPPQQSKKFGFDVVVKRLQRRYGVGDKHSSRINMVSTTTTSSSSSTTKKRHRNEIPTTTMKTAVLSNDDDDEVTSCARNCDVRMMDTLPDDVTVVNEHVCDVNSVLDAPARGEETIEQQQTPNKRRKDAVRSDLFFVGIVVLINGYTNPDAETLQRLLQKHGGDVEKYETTRITHVIAERLSKAKANVYKHQQRNPKPVCKPKWITDSVQAYQLLPYQNYILDDIKIDNNIRSVASMFAQHQTIGMKNLVVQATDSTKMSQSISQYNLACHPNFRKSKTALYDSEEITADSSPATSNIYTKVDRYNGKYLDHMLHEEFSNEACQIDSVQDKESIQCTEIPLMTNPPVAALVLQEFNPSEKSKKEERYVHGSIRTVGTDPNFLESFFASSRLSFIGSYRQRQQLNHHHHHQQSSSVNQCDMNSAAVERFVFHVDMDCFFASVALRNYPQYRDQPVAISHNGDTTDHGSRQQFKDSTSECATCNYVARKYGIQKGMYLSQAKALCPSLIVLPYDYEGYEEVSDIVSDILDRHASEFNGYVEYVSCDEVYMELFVPFNENKLPRGIISDVAETIRIEIFSMTQCTASVGVATNKFLAKLATDHAKPNRSFVMDDYHPILKLMKLRDLHGIGYKMGQRLENNGLFSVQDIWDLGEIAEAELCGILGAGLGKKIYGYCYGKDDREIQASKRKTIGAEVSIYAAV